MSETYSVKYYRGGLEKELDNVIADGFVPDYPMRFFILKTGERIEIPIADCEFRFSKERNKNIKEVKK